MRRMWCLAASAIVALWTCELGLSAQKQQQVFINLAAPNGTPVTDLQASEVSITEDGVDCKIAKLEFVNWPIALQVLVDNGPRNTNPINPLRDGLKGLFELMPDGVEMSLYTTAGRPRPIVKPTTEKQKMMDGISLIAPDGGAGMFLDALVEAAGRIDKDKTPNFPVIVMVGSDFGKVSASDRDYQKLQDIIRTRAVTVHIIVMVGGAAEGATGGAAQTELGLAVTKLSGGRSENIATTTRLATLLPELGKTIAESDARQRRQYRVTYERPANPKPQPRIGATIRREGAFTLSLDGHRPYRKSGYGKQSPDANRREFSCGPAGS